MYSSMERVREREEKIEKLFADQMITFGDSMIKTAESTVGLLYLY